MRLAESVRVLLRPTHLRRSIQMSSISASAAPIMECMAVAPASVNESAKAESEATTPIVQRRRATKIVLATRYGVGIRTIENWQYAGIIRAGLEQGQAVFDVADCDERLLSYK